MPSILNWKSNLFSWVGGIYKTLTEKLLSSYRGSGVGADVGIGTGEAIVAGVELAVGVSDEIGDASPITTLTIAHLVIDILRVSASIESTVRLFLYLTVIRFAIYPHLSSGGNQLLGSRSPFCLFNPSDTATSALGSVKSFA